MDTVIKHKNKYKYSMNIKSKDYQVFSSFMRDEVWINKSSLWEKGGKTPFINDFSFSKVKVLLWNGVQGNVEWQSFL